MFCKSCGKKIDDDSTFCIYCGKKHGTRNVVPTQTSVKNTLQDFSSPTPAEYIRRKGDVLACGLILLIGGALGVAVANNSNGYDVMLLISIIYLIIRFAIAQWVYSLAKQLNREPVSWAVGGFLFPAIALIIISMTRKL